MDEHGTDVSNNTTSTRKAENNIFEAVGGDTILASNPVAWATTVGDYHIWRVINRDTLSPLGAVLSAIPGYQQVQDYFFQAAPAISKYIELSDGRYANMRLRLVAPNRGLSIWQTTNPAYYLAHAPLQTVVTPRLMYLQNKFTAL